MQTSSKRRYLQTHTPIKGVGLKQNVAIDDLLHRDRVLGELRKLGVSKLGLLRMESRYLPKIIHPDEVIKAVVYGRSSDGFAMLVATDRRIIFLDRKPMFVKEDEITYDVVSGVSHSQAGVGSTVVLNTRIKNYKIRTFNSKCATGFVDYIETHCLESIYTQRAHRDFLI